LVAFLFPETSLPAAAMVALSRVAAAALAASFGLQCVVSQGGQQRPQKMEPPKWLSDEGKDLFNDVEASEKLFDGLACENREKLLKQMVGKSDQGAADYRSRVLLGLGLCNYRTGDFGTAAKRFDSMISEMGAPSEDALLKNPNSAPMVLMKQASQLMHKNELTQAGTAVRRCVEIQNRNLKKIMKMIHKQMSEQQGGTANVPPVEALYEELGGFGRTGQVIPMLLKQNPMLKQELQWAELLDNALSDLDTSLQGVDKSLKGKAQRLATSKGKDGSLSYAKALITDATSVASRIHVAEELAKMKKDFVKEAEKAEKAVSFIKRTKDGSGCKKGGDFEKTCEALKKIADIRSNPFGETRLVVAKKTQKLDVCQTNANVGVLMAAKDGAKALIAGVAEPLVLKAGEPVGVDFCLEVTIEASSPTPVLFAQAWHPEYAAVERTTDLRARSKSLGLSEAEVKAATEVANAHAKSSWEKAGKQWRTDSPLITSIKETLEAEKGKKAKAAEDKREASQKAEMEGDEERTKGLEELERKRAEKKKAQEAAEAKRKARVKQLEEERAMRDPWLNCPAVQAAEKRIEELKEARRDANAKLEFDLSTQLTSDISQAERDLKKTTKLNRKSQKKTGNCADGNAPGSKKEAAEGADNAAAAKEELPTKTEEKKAKGPGGDKAAALKKELEEVKKQKAKASEEENFKEAKQLKEKQKDLEAKIQKLEL